MGIGAAGGIVAFLWSLSRDVRALHRCMERGAVGAREHNRGEALDAARDVAPPRWGGYRPVGRDVAGRYANLARG